MVDKKHFVLTSLKLPNFRWIWRSSSKVFTNITPRWYGPVGPRHTVTFFYLPTLGINSIFTRCKIVGVHLDDDRRLTNTPSDPQFKVLFEVTVEEEDLDSENNIHNGCIATLLDVLMSVATLSRISKPGRQAGVTVDLNITLVLLEHRDDYVKACFAAI